MYGLTCVTRRINNFGLNRASQFPYVKMSERGNMKKSELGSPKSEPDRKAILVQ